MVKSDNRLAQRFVDFMHWTKGVEYQKIDRDGITVTDGMLDKPEFSKAVQAFAWPKDSMCMPINSTYIFIISNEYQ